MSKYSILGYDPETYCDHCGRPLKIGIRLSSFGVIGADCLNTAIQLDLKRWGGGKPGADLLRHLAKCREKFSQKDLERMGYYSRAFDVDVVPEKLIKL